jgi:hypothetical protein
MTRKTLLVGALVASSAAFSLQSFADDLYINVDPPARRAEKYEQRPGQVWVPGVWEWRNGKHEWTTGHYVAEKRGYRYAPDRWVQHDNKKWTMQRGGWSRDSDGDGVPDRLDNYPNNPRRQ